MDVDKILAITLSGVRPGEDTAVLELIAGCNLTIEDLSREKMRHFLLARKGDRIVGVVGLEIAAHEALLRSLAVHDSFRHQGIASRLIGAIEGHAADIGVQALYLLTQSAADFFAKLNYAITDRTAAPPAIQGMEEFKRLCPDTAVCMFKSLSS